MVFAEKTLTQIEQMSALEQAQVMCDLVFGLILPSAVPIRRLAQILSWASGIS